MPLMLGLVLSIAASVFTASDMLDIRTFARGQPIVLSSDGAYVAYVLTDVNDEWNVAARRPRGHLYVQRLGEAAKPLSAGETTGSFPAWSPDGTRLALFLEGASAGRLALWRVGDDGPVALGEPFTGRAYLAPQWDSSGKRVIYAAAVAPALKPPAPRVQVVRSSDTRIPGDEFFIDTRRARLAYVEVDSTQSHWLTEGPVRVRGFHHAGDSVSYRAPTEDTFGLVGGEEQETVTVSLGDHSPAASTALDSGKATLFRLMPDPTLVDPELEPRQANQYSIAQPFMDLHVRDKNVTAELDDQVSDPVASADGRHIFFKSVNNHDYRESIYQFHTDTERLVRLTGGAESYSHLSVGANRLIFTAESATHPAELFTIDLDSGKLTALTELNPQLEAFDFSTPELFHFHKADGERLGALLYKPATANAVAKPPVITYVYEKLTPLIHRFQPRHQIFVSHGYAVLMPNVKVKVGETATSFVDSVVPAVNAVRERGITNGKFCMWGGSFGAFATSFVITQTDLFECAVSRATPPELFRNWASGRDRDSNNIERGQARMGGSPFEVMERYLAQSAFFHLDKVQTPVLLLHGVEDKTILVGEGEMMFYALRRLGKRAELVLYRDGDHSLYRHSRSDALDVHQRMLDWFDHYLRP